MTKVIATITYKCTQTEEIVTIPFEKLEIELTYDGHGNARLDYYEIYNCPSCKGYHQVA